MSEWPITICAHCARREVARPGSYGYGRSGHDETEVIPADLGRELYEALRYATIAVAVHQPNMADGFREVLARYEREVGG